ncbi:hypothetical protein DFP72DRAFT_1071843 [Ephemerocybe angulata]|uniref:Uncharacterized protein n=1 Tax=Ephemerocybe angulata TaxID=980116 RepID=A0A8H6HQP4_9AGAR|nr:hypothetical protein DFP72DRAFT_1071843 [Tulosesus angulatus]
MNRIADSPPGPNPTHVSEARPFGLWAYLRVPSSKKANATEAKRQSKQRAVASSKLKEEKENNALLATTTKSTCSTTKVYITDPALRKWVLENDPRCRIVDAKIVRCIPCNRKITLEDVYYLSAWFRHIEKSATHKKREKEWAVGASIDRDTLFKKAPKVRELRPYFLLEPRETHQMSLAGSEVPGVGEKAIAEKEDVEMLKVPEKPVPEAVSVEVRKEAEEPIAAQAVEGSDDEESDSWLGFQYLPRHGGTTSSYIGDMECECTSVDGGCEHGIFSLCAKGADCTLVVCTLHLDAAYLYIA